MNRALAALIGAVAALLALAPPAHADSTTPDPCADFQYHATHPLECPAPPAPPQGAPVVQPGVKFVTHDLDVYRVVLDNSASTVPVLYQWRYRNAQGARCTFGVWVAAGETYRTYRQAVRPHSVLRVKAMAEGLTFRWHVWAGPFLR